MTKGFLSGLSIIIATTENQEHLNRAVCSCLNQDFSKEAIEVIVVFYGQNKVAFEQLEQEYSHEDRVDVVFSEHANPNYARNLGANLAKKEWITFLEETDYLSDSFVAQANDLISDDVAIVQARVELIRKEGTIDNTFTNRLIRKVFGADKSDASIDYLTLAPFFRALTAKIYKKALWAAFDKLPEDSQNSEASLFWAENYRNINGAVIAFPHSSSEAYIASSYPPSPVLDTQESRQAFLEEKLDVIASISNLFWKTESLEHKQFIIKAIQFLEGGIVSEAKKEPSLPVADLANSSLLAHKQTLLNTSLAAQKKGVCFSYYMVPDSDVSAYMSIQRLEQINALEGINIAWDLYGKTNDTVRSTDNLYDQLYASRVYNTRISVAPSEPLTIDYPTLALTESILNRADFIYSRSMKATSHRAAFRYKQLYPDAKWYAEFSDPLSRHLTGVLEGDLGEKYERIEQLVYENADKIIFTNENQLEYMLSYNIQPELNDAIRQKALVWPHPIMDKKYVNIVESDYETSPDKINVAYFGSFYKGSRGHHEILNFLKNDNIVLHLFILNYFYEDDISIILKDAEDLSYDTDRLKVNKSVPVFEMLNIASKMDYLYLEDTGFSGPINPYLPSKYATYKTACQTGKAKIIARISSGSILSQAKDKYLIKTTVINADFVNNL